jgi:hypothetical protein
LFCFVQFFLSLVQNKPSISGTHNKTHAARLKTEPGANSQETNSHKPTNPNTSVANIVGAELLTLVDLDVDADADVDLGKSCLSGKPASCASVLQAADGANCTIGQSDLFL